MPDGDESTPARLRAVPVRALGVVVVGMSVAVWWPAFQLGAWGEIFFDVYLTVWAAATGAFLIAIVHGPTRRRMGWWNLALLLPSAYLVLNFVFPRESSDLVHLGIVAVGALVSLLGIPFTIWVLIRMIWPELIEDIPARARLVVFLVVALVAVAAFFLGVFENRFLSCEDYTISGNSTPGGCISSQPDE